MIRHGQRAGLVAAAIALAYLGFGILNAPANEHRVHLELIDESTSWPWHSSIQRASAVWINSPAGQEWAGDAEVVARRPRNIVDLFIVATGPSAGGSADAAEDTADAFITHDRNTRAEPVELRIDALSSELATLRDEFTAQEAAGSTASNSAQIAIRSTRLEGTAATIGALEGQRTEAKEELAAQITRYEMIDSRPISPLQDRLPETLKLFTGVGFLLFLAQTLYAKRSAEPGAQSFAD